VYREQRQSISENIRFLRRQSISGFGNTKDFLSGYLRTWPCGEPVFINSSPPFNRRSKMDIMTYLVVGFFSLALMKSLWTKLHEEK
jgi:hypothetical protein